jgi:hypothetical protein
MKEYNDFLSDEIEREYGKFLRCKDLIDLGLYSSPAAVSLSIKNDNAPPYIRISPHKLLFPKVTLLAWLKSKFIIEKAFRPKPPES